MRRTRIVACLAGSAALMAALAPSSAFGVDSVSQTVTPGVLTASVANLDLGDVAYAHAAHNHTGSMTLTADDSTGSGDGWNVTIQTSDFVYSGSAHGGTDIPAANFSLTSAATPVMTAGQAVDGTDGPKVPASSPVGTLDSARKVVQANINFGLGTYTQALGVSLAIPALSRAGTYTGTLTTSITAAP